MEKGYTLPKHQTCKDRPVVEIRVGSDVVYLALAMIVSVQIPTPKWSPTLKWSPNRLLNNPQLILGMERYPRTMDRS